MKTITTRGLAVSACLVLLSACGGGGGSGGGGNNVTASSSTPDPELPAVTWYSAAQPLVERYCVTCHRDGGIAPFPLETYDQVLSKRSALVYSLETDTMPPLGFVDLADAERQLLIDWANNGAPKGDPSQTPEPAPVSLYTYHADIRPLLDKHCISCHVEGGIAPFPLDSFDDVRGVSAAIAYSLEQGTMPPWPPTSGYTRIENDRLLSDEEKYVFLAWLASDMPEGNPADYQPTASAPVDNPDNYNLKLQLPQPYTPIVQPDDHRCFAIEWPEDEFTYVTGVSVIPDQEEEVHHERMTATKSKNVV